jgi:hypothetical protein
MELNSSCVVIILRRYELVCIIPTLINRYQIMFIRIVHSSRHSFLRMPCHTNRFHIMYIRIAHSSRLFFFFFFFCFGIMLWCADFFFPFILSSQVYRRVSFSLTCESISYWRTTLSCIVSLHLTFFASIIAGTPTPHAESCRHLPPLASHTPLGCRGEVGQWSLRWGCVYDVIILGEWERFGCC